MYVFPRGNGIRSDFQIKYIDGNSSYYAGQGGNNTFYLKLTQQVEEEATATKNLGKLKLIGGKGEGLLMIDAELASRTFKEPVTE